MSLDPILFFVALVYALMTTLLTLGTTILVTLILVDQCHVWIHNIKERRRNEKPTISA